MDARFTSNGTERPVYLRKFVCGTDRVRLWDMDRFADGTGPDLLAYRRREQDSGLDRAFARYFADQGAALLEISPGAGEVRAARLLEQLRRGGKGAESALAGYLGVHRRGEAEGLRLVLPAIPR